MNEIELSEKEYFNHEGGDTMHVFFYKTYIVFAKPIIIIMVTQLFVGYLNHDL